MKGLEELLKEASSVFVFGIGGGGDVVSAIPTWRYAKLLGCDAILGGVVWERLAVDPNPGPTPTSCLVNAKALCETAAVVSRDTVARRNGTEYKPQVARVAEALGVETIALDISRGAHGLVEALKAIGDEYGVDVFIGIDVGGDVLASPLDDYVWSPLADAIGLAALTEVNGVLGVAGPGVDGELPQHVVLQRISAVARKGGLLGARGLSPEDADVLSKVLEYAHTEASRIPLLAFKGFYGETSIRRGYRTVIVNPVSALTFYLDARTANEINVMARAVAGTKSIDEARKRLHALGVFTELDLEEELARNPGADPVKVRDEGRRRIRERFRKAYGCSL